MKLKDAILAKLSEPERIFHYYWGSDITRTLEERKLIAELTRIITERTHGVIASVPVVVDALLKEYRNNNQCAYNLLSESVGMVDNNGIRHD